MLDALTTMKLAAALGAGVLLGAFYFGGLWWSVRRMPESAHPLRLYFGSLAVRMAVALGGLFALLLVCDWPPLAVALAGFIAVRFVLFHFLRPPSTADTPAQEGAV